MVKIANKELYDYFSTATPDYDAFLDVLSPKAVIEDADKNQVTQYFDDGTNRVISLSDEPIAYIKLTWHDGVTESDAGIIMDFFLDSNKANGYAKSFKYAYPHDGHTYVVKFASKLIRNRTFIANIGYVPVGEVTLKIVGTISD